MSGRSTAKRRVSDSTAPEVDDRASSVSNPDFWVGKSWTARQVSGWREWPTLSSTLPSTEEVEALAGRWKREVGLYLEISCGLAVQRLSVASLPAASLPLSGQEEDKGENAGSLGLVLSVETLPLAAGRRAGGVGKRSRAGGGHEAGRGEGEVPEFAEGGCVGMSKELRRRVQVHVGTTL
jgi:hypothetical protein